MLKLFDPNNTTVFGSTEASHFQQFKRLAENVEHSISNYYRHHAYRTDNNHILVQLLKNLEFSLETPFQRVVETVYSRSQNMARHFNLTSQISYGSPFKRCIYAGPNNDCMDYLFSNNIVDVDPFDEEKNWVNLSPLKVIHHPSEDFNFLTYLNGYEKPLKGYSVIHIDIPLLALQYREFCQEQVNSFGDDGVYNPNKFLITRVFPKLFRSHVDYVLLNLLKCQVENRAPDFSYQGLPLSLPSLQGLGIKIVSEVRKNRSNKRSQYIQTLQTFPSVFHISGAEFLKLPVVVLTRQLNWLQLFSRLPVIETLIKLQGYEGKQANSSYLSMFKEEARTFITGREFQYIKPQELQEEVKQKVIYLSNL